MIRLAFAFVFVASAAFADEQVTPIAEGGDWIAVQHTASMTDPPDVCGAIDTAANLIIRLDSSDIEFRLSNDSWALPANVTGTLELDVAGDKYPLAISDNTNTRVDAVVTNDQLLAIIGDMNKATTMTAIAGRADPVQVNLIGSGPVLTAFLTCGGIAPPNNINGDTVSNPFGPAPPNDTPAAPTQPAPAAPEESQPQTNANPVQSSSVPAAVADYDQGHADRQAAEAWIDSLTGPQKQGALFWAGQRSLKQPESCTDGASGAFPSDATDQANFIDGCMEYAARLTPLDKKRLSDPLYRAGWNAPILANAPGAVPAPDDAEPPLPNPSAVGD